MSSEREMISFFKFESFYKNNITLRKVVNPYEFITCVVKVTLKMFFDININKCMLQRNIGIVRNIVR